MYTYDEFNIYEIQTRNGLRFSTKNENDYPKLESFESWGDLPCQIQKN